MDPSGTLPALSVYPCSLVSLYDVAKTTNANAGEQFCTGPDA